MFGKRRHESSDRTSVGAARDRRSLLSPVLLVAFIAGWAISFGALMFTAPSRDASRAVVTLPVSTKIPVGLPRGEIPLALPPLAKIENGPRQDTPSTEPPGHTVVPTSPSTTPPVPEIPPTEQRTVIPLPAVRPVDDPPLWRRHAVAIPDSAGKPMIAIVIDDLGLDLRRSGMVTKLPGPLTLAYLPYANDLRRQTAVARDQGHELMVHVSMQPLGSDNPGPNPLTTDLPPGEIKRRLDWALAAFDGYVGINNHMGSLFTTNREGMAVVMEVLKARGLLFLDSRTGQNSVGPSTATAHDVPHAARHVFIDHELTTRSIMRQLSETEKIAHQAGFVVAIGHPHDVTIAALEAWLPSLEVKGLVLAPISAIVARLEARREASQSSMTPLAP